MVHLKAIIEFAIKKQSIIKEMTIQHLQMVMIAMAISICLGLVIGFLITYNKLAANIVLYLASICMTVPSLALFSFLTPLLGLNMKPVIVGLVIYTLLPIIRNTYVGLTVVDPAIIDAARGMGMTDMTINFKVRFPLAMPVIFAGIRSAMVLGIGIGAIAAYVGAGGLGVYIFQGINRGNIKMVAIAAVLIVIICVVSDKLLGLVQHVSEKRLS